MATDVIEAVDCPAVRLWLGFEPNAMMLPPVHAGDAVGYDFHAVWERDHYAHYDAWVQKRVPWIAKLEKAQRLEIKRRRNEVTAGDAPSRRTSATPGAPQSMAFSASFRGLVVGGGGAENAAADTAADGKEGSGSGSGSESGSERRRSIAMLVHLKKNLARLRQVRRALLLDPVPVPVPVPLSHTRLVRTPWRRQTATVAEDGDIADPAADGTTASTVPSAGTTPEGSPKPSPRGVGVSMSSGGGPSAPIMMRQKSEVARGRERTVAEAVGVPSTETEYHIGGGKVVHINGQDLITNWAQVRSCLRPSLLAPPP